MGLFDSEKRISLIAQKEQALTPTLSQEERELATDDTHESLLSSKGEEGGKRFDTELEEKITENKCEKKEKNEQSDREKYIVEIPK